MERNERYTFYIEKDHARVMIISYRKIVREILIDLEFVSAIRQFNISFKGKHVIYYTNTTTQKQLAHYVLGMDKLFVRIKYKNGDKCDLRKRNLIEQKAKEPDNKKSDVVGVTWIKIVSKWAARVTHKKETHYLGLFDSEILAISAVIMKRIQLLDQK